MKALTGPRLHLGEPASTACTLPPERLSGRAGSLRLAAQDVALSRRKQGFESPRERQFISCSFCFQQVSAMFVQRELDVCNICVLVLTPQFRRSKLGKFFLVGCIGALL
jgi:hypothetical protein